LWRFSQTAGFARGFIPDGQPFRFHGWRNGVMVMKSKDGTLYSCLTGIAFDGPRKGTRLQPEPTLLSDWGFWQKRYPAAVAYFMYDKYKPLELSGAPNEDSLKTRGPVDPRLPADTMVEERRPMAADEPMTQERETVPAAPIETRDRVVTPE